MPLTSTSLIHTCTMSNQSKNSPFRVIIVGGGIGGLTIANALQLAGVDFVLLEGRSVIDPQVGASIGIFPNGGRILDQLGCYDNVLELIEPMVEQSERRADGSQIGETNNTPILTMNRSVAHCLIFSSSLTRIGLDIPHASWTDSSSYVFLPTTSPINQGYF